MQSCNSQIKRVKIVTKSSSSTMFCYFLQNSSNDACDNFAWNIKGSEEGSKNTKTESDHDQDDD